MGGRRRPRRAPGSTGTPAASSPPKKKKAHRRLWGVRLTKDMMARLEAAFTTVPAGKNTVVAYLMAATGATRSNVRTWLRNGR